MTDEDRAVVNSLKEAVLELNKVLVLAATMGIEVSPQFNEATSMEHLAPLLELSIELTKHLGTV